MMGVTDKARSENRASLAVIPSQARGAARADARATALFVSAFFDELIAGGVRCVVVAPGSRSTPLAVVAYEAQRRSVGRLRMFVDVDERGAAFLALGFGKATGRPACVICTSGTAVANLYPAVMEAEASRIPLILLTGDRPARLQGLGAPQTCDQLHAFGAHVAVFRQMPPPSSDTDSIAFARQAAREALVAAGGADSSDEAALPSGAACGMRFADAPGAPVHVNFPFEEPLVPDCASDELFFIGRTGARADAQRAGGRDDSSSSGKALGAPSAFVRPRASAGDLAKRLEPIVRRIVSSRTVVLAGEGAVRTEADARSLLAWAEAQRIPLLADPLSGLRSFNRDIVIDHYDNVFARPGWPQIDTLVRFGRWPVSKRATQALAEARPFEVVVDERETRDFNAMTAAFVQCAPRDFVEAMREATQRGASARALCAEQQSCADAWIAANANETARIAKVDEETLCLEGPIVRAILDAAPDESCIVVANSMAIRSFDTFFTKRDKRLRLLCNRGLNGIDGTVSTAVGAALAYGSATLVIGDLALLHDLNALALQRELLGEADRLETRGRGGAAGHAPTLVIVVLDNNGGAIFDMLPQSSDDPSFERLFLTPQDVRFDAVARAFAIPQRTARMAALFRDAYAEALETPGMSLIDVPLPLRGVEERYGRYW